jgi:hypothetical protein
LTRTCTRNGGINLTRLLGTITVGTLVIDPLLQGLDMPIMIAIPVTKVFHPTTYSARGHRRCTGFHAVQR